MALWVLYNRWTSAHSSGLYCLKVQASPGMTSLPCVSVTRQTY